MDKQDYNKGIEPTIPEIKNKHSTKKMELKKIFHNLERSVFAHKMNEKLLEYEFKLWIKQTTNLEYRPKDNIIIYILNAIYR